MDSTKSPLESQTAPIERPPVTSGPTWSFGLISVLWVVAIVSAGASINGEFSGRLGGVVAASGCVMVWAAILDFPYAPRLYREACGAFGACLLLSGLSLIGAGLLLIGAAPAISPPPGVRCASCKQRMQDLAFAVRHHLLRSGRLPDDIATENGDEVSWRTLFLPDLGGGDFFEAEGSEGGAVNLATAQQAAVSPYCFRCYDREPYSTYFAVRGGGAAWPLASESQPAIGDYDCDTVLLIEAPSERFGQWYDASDLSFEEGVQLLTDRPEAERSAHWERGGLFHTSGPICNVAFADGSVRTLHLPMSEGLAAAILTANGEEWQIRSQLDAAAAPKTNWSNVWAVVAFVILALGPMFSRLEIGWRDRRKQQIGQHAW